MLLFILPFLFCLIIFSLGLLNADLPLFILVNKIIMEFYYNSGVESLLIYRDMFISLKNDIKLKYCLENVSNELCKIVMSPEDYTLYSVYSLEITKLTSQIYN